MNAAASLSLPSFAISLVNYFTDSLARAGCVNPWKVLTPSANINYTFECIPSMIYDDFEYFVSSDDGVLVTTNLDVVLRFMEDLGSHFQPKSKRESVAIFEVPKPI